MERLCFSFARGMDLAYISHLDIMRLLLRALRRSSLPLAYSKGYNPHPRLTLALPLPLGVTAAEEFGEVFMHKPVGPEKFKHALVFQLPAALEVTGTAVLSPQLPALASQVSAARYRVFIGSGENQENLYENLGSALDSLLAKEEIIMERKKKREATYLNVRPYIYEASLYQDGAQALELSLLLKAGSSGAVSPFFVIEQLQAESTFVLPETWSWHVHREKIYKGPEEELRPLIEGMWESKWTKK